MAFDVGSVIAHIKADITDFKGGLDKAKQEAGNFQRTLSGIGDGVADFGKKAAIMTGVVAAGVGLIGKMGIDSAAKFEQYQIAFNTLLKDEKKAAEAIQQIQQDAAKTPFELAPLVAANQRLISAGISAKDARVDIINLGNAISATGGGGAELERLSTNLQQIKAVGKASALDIKQFAFAGINVYQMLADSTGKTVEQVREMDITYDMLSESFEKASGKGGMFEDAMLKQSKTLNGLMSTLRDTVSLGLKDILINSGAFDVIRNAVAQLIPFLESIVPKIVEFFQNIPKDPTVIAVFNFLKDALTKLSAWINENQETVITFLKGLAIAFGALVVIGTITALITALANPLVLIALLIAALYTAWQTNFLGIRDVVMTVVTEIVNFWNNYLLPAIKVVADYFVERWVYIKTMLDGLWKIIIGIIQTAWAIVYGIIKLGLAILSGDWSAAWEAIKGILSGAWEGIKKIFTGMIDFLKGWGGWLWEELTSPFRRAWDEISKIVQKIKDALDFTKRHSPSVVDIVNRGVNLVNDALDGIAWNGSINANAAGLAVSRGGNNTSNIMVKIDMAGAFIGDNYGAQQMAELMGDSIIKKLQSNIRV